MFVIHLCMYMPNLINSGLFGRMGELDPVIITSNFDARVVNVWDHRIMQDRIKLTLF